MAADTGMLPALSCALSFDCSEDRATEPEIGCDAYVTSCLLCILIIITAQQQEVWHSLALLSVCHSLQHLSLHTAECLKI